MLAAHRSCIQLTTRFANGEHADLFPTDAGNIRWDLMTLFDQQTASCVLEMEEMEDIVTPYPHYHSESADRSRTFNHSVYVGKPAQGC